MGTKTVQFQDPELLENIENLESNLLEYETGMLHGVDRTALVPVIFRYAHNIKSSLGMLGFKDASRLIHEVESCFDLVRNARRHATDQLVKATLQVVDILRHHLARPEEALPDATAIVRDLQAFLHGTVQEDMSIPLPFALTLPEAAAVSDALGQGCKLRLMESLVFTNLDEADYGALPCFEQARQAGELLAWHPRWHDLPRDQEATVISLVLATRLDDDAFGRALGNPWRPVRQPECQHFHDPDGLPAAWTGFLEARGFRPLGEADPAGPALVVLAAGSPRLAKGRAARRSGVLVLAADVAGTGVAGMLAALDAGADTWAASLLGLEREIRYLETLGLTALAGRPEEVAHDV